ncbi:TIGR04222 domain-containing membrane protein, partial [Thiocystis violacea]|uniref:TIGR04222 domain-containing membrane protein n=1 Tax=Thiocystis violacea TaxID=13725 RepID=UPI0031FA3EB4|nr:hypothetical protein [Thiocystis violacea]
MLPLTIGFSALFGVGVIRLIAGVLVGRPVGFLVISLALTALLAGWLLRGLGRERATAHGKRLLEAGRSQLGRGGDDRLWMVALLGLAGYGMGPLVDLHHVMHVAANDSLFGGSSPKGKGGDSSGAGGGG